METEIEKKIKEILKIGREKELYPEIKVVEGGISSKPKFITEGKKILSFCSFDCLGLANNKKVKKAIIEGLNRYGIHPCGAVLISGTLKIHRELEKKIANFLGKEDALIFHTTTMANMGVIPAIINLSPTSLFSFLKIPFKGTDAVIFSDQFNHATIIEGCRLAKAERVIYKHCDMNDLENKLKKYNKRKMKLIVTDGVFSIDGDIAPLPDIINLAKKYGAMVYIDDVNATGILGKNGKGTMEYFGLKNGVDIIVTGFSKCFGVVGGIAASSKEIIDYLRVSAKTYVFSGGFLGSLALGILKALEIIKNAKMERIKLLENAEYLRNKLQRAGFDTLKSESPIIPILIGDEKTTINMARDLFNRSILSMPIRWPAVPHGQARMRFIVTIHHTKEQIDTLVENLIIVGKKYKII
jgi:8-amino-7-oxononanoate synthase